MNSLYVISIGYFIIAAAHLQKDDKFGYLLYLALGVIGATIGHIFK